MLTNFLAYAISVFGDIIIMLICVRAIMSWFQGAFSYGIRRFYDALGVLTEPFIQPFRRLIARFTYSIGIDFSPLIAIVVVRAICYVIARLLFMI